MERATDPERSAVECSGGEVVDDMLVELLAPTGSIPQILAFSSCDSIVGDQIVVGGKLLKPIPLNSLACNAVTLPARLDESRNYLEFVPAISEALSKRFELTEYQLAAVTMWIVYTWLWDFYRTPLTLLLAGSMEPAMALLGFMSAGVRRGLCLADLSQASLRSLPLNMQPVLLINRYDLPQQLLSTLRFSSYSGFRVPGSRNTLLNLAIPRALFLGDQEVQDDWTDLAIRINLPPRCNRQSCYENNLTHMISDFQSLGLLFRLRYWVEVIRNNEPVLGLTQQEIAEKLLGDFCGMRELATNAKSYFTAQEDQQFASRSRDPKSAILEVLWGPMHAGKPIGVSEVASRLNALLHNRGELIDLRSEQVGFLLSDLGIPRRRSQREKRIEFTREVSQRLHRLSSGFQLELPVDDKCLDCPRQDAAAE